MVQVNQKKEQKNLLPLRIAFSKVGRLQYISHLDLQRTMTHALIRARIPVWYTEGFNPKPRLNFSTPLSIGTESRYELMDFRIVLEDGEALPDLAAMRDQLNATLPDELVINDIYTPSTKFSDIRYSRYTISVFEDNIEDETVAQCRGLLSAKTLLVMKRTKSGEKETDIAPMIFSLTVERGEGRLLLNATLTASPDAFLNPEYLVKILFDADVLPSRPSIEREYTIMREDLLDADGARFV